MNKIIELNNVSFDYDGYEQGVHLLEDFSLAFERGTFNVILGHNGSGKSTLAKLLNGLIRPVSGQVLVNGIPTSDDSKVFEVKKTVGIVFQNPDNQIVSSIVEEDVAFGPENLGFSSEETRKRVDDALLAVDMYDHRKAPTHSLSGGQKQRIAIAGIIAMAPECIVLDEPTAMLDPKGRKEVLSTILRLNKEKGITIILITHYMEEAENADRVMVMSDGRITADGTPTEVFSEVNKIREAGLDVPQTIDLLDKLKKQGFNIKTDVISKQACADEIISLLAKRERS